MRIGRTPLACIIVTSIYCQGEAEFYLNVILAVEGHTQVEITNEASLLLYAFNKKVLTMSTGPRAYKSFVMCTTDKIFENSFRPIDENVDESLTQFGNWKVNDDGSLSYLGTMQSFKDIETMPLTNIDFYHVMSRGWTDYKEAADFFLAYLQAAKNAGYKSVVIDLSNRYLSKLK